MVLQLLNSIRNIALATSTRARGETAVRPLPSALLLRPPFVVAHGPNQFPSHALTPFLHSPPLQMGPPFKCGGCRARHRGGHILGDASIILKQTVTFCACNYWGIVCSSLCRTRRFRFAPKFYKDMDPSGKTIANTDTETDNVGCAKLTLGPVIDIVD